MPADCNQQQALCARFGVGPDAEGESPGLPHILWFKAGKEVGGYDGAHTLEGFTSWVGVKQSSGEL